MFHYFTKLSAIIVVSIFLLAPPTFVYAQASAVDPVDMPFDILQGVNSVIDKVNKFKDILKEYGLDKVAYTVAQKVSEKMTVSIVNKINGGASGDKDLNYITNFKQHFSDIGTKQLNDYTAELRASSNPFATQVERALIDRSSGFSSSGINNFTLNKIPGVDWQSASSDLSYAGSRGLEFYSQLAKPQNTPVGALAVAQNELTQRIESATEASKIELTSSGFTPSKDDRGCVTGNGSTVRSNQFAYDQQLASLQQQRDALENRLVTEGDPAQAGSIESQITSIENQINALVAQGPEEGEKFSANVDPNCLITSPGNVVSSLSKLALEEPIVRNRTADEFFKIVANSLTQITSAAINKGISSLRRTGQLSGNLGVVGSRGYFGSPADVRKFESGSSTINAIPTVVIDLNKELNDTVPRIQKITGIIKDTMDIMRLIPVVASDLDICTPGPDINWQARLNDYVLKKTKGLQRSASKDSNKGEDAADTLDDIEVGVDIAKQEMSVIVTNPLYNIPGASESLSMIQAVTAKTSQFQELLDRLVVYQGALNTLLSIQSTIRVTALGYQYDQAALTGLTSGELATIQGIGKLVLFNEDWNGVNPLTQQQKDALYKASLITLPEVVTLPTDPTDRDIAMRTNVLEWQWELWTDFMETTPEQQKEKQLIYVSINEARENLVTESQVVQAESYRNQVIQDVESIGEQFNACLLMRTIFVNAIYNSNLPYQIVNRSIDANNNLIETPQTLTVVNSSALQGNGSAAYKLAKRLYVAGDLESLKNDIINAIPEKKEVLQKALLKKSILDLTDQEVQEVLATNKNLLGNSYQTGNLVIPTTIERVLERDTRGLLFCTLQKTGFTQATGNPRRYHEIYCNPNGGLPIMIPDIVSGSAPNPVSRAKSNARGIAFNWYFSSGLNDYIRFDLYAP